MQSATSAWGWREVGRGLEGPTGSPEHLMGMDERLQDGSNAYPAPTEVGPGRDGAPGFGARCARDAIHPIPECKPGGLGAHVPPLYPCFEVHNSTAPG